MYLEMLQQRYGAELEKQAMEKQALNPMQLIQMGRRFAAKGKLDRFGQLLAKRNKVLKHSKSLDLRDKIESVLRKTMEDEVKWLGKIGPTYEKWLPAINRTRSVTSAKDLNRILKNATEPYDLKQAVLVHRPAPAMKIDDLARWSRRLQDIGL